MEGEQGRGERHVDPAPNPGLDFLKLDPDPGDGLVHGGVLRCGGRRLSGQVWMPTNSTYFVTFGGTLVGSYRFSGQDIGFDLTSFTGLPMLFASGVRHGFNPLAVSSFARR